MDQKYRELFLTSASEHIEKLSQACALLQEKNNSESVISDMHVHAHSLKGEAFVMGYQQFGNFSSVVEHYLKELQQRQSIVPEKHIFVLHDAIRRLKEVLEEIKTHERDPDLTQEIGVLMNQLEVKV